MPTQSSYTLHSIAQAEHVMIHLLWEHVRVLAMGIACKFVKMENSTDIHLHAKIQTYLSNNLWLVHQNQIFH